MYIGIGVGVGVLLIIVGIIIWIMIRKKKIKEEENKKIKLNIANRNNQRKMLSHGGGVPARRTIAYDDRYNRIPRDVNRITLTSDIHRSMPRPRIGNNPRKPSIETRNSKNRLIIENPNKSYGPKRKSTTYR